MNHRAEILDEYLELAFLAQELDYYYEMGTGSYADFDKARERAMEYYHAHGITRQELTDYKKRDTIKVKSAEEAVSVLNRMFS